MATAGCIVEGRNRLGESPVWSVADQCLYWVDSRGPAVFRLGAGGSSAERRVLPAIVGSICLRASGGLVVALQSGLHFYDFDRDRLSLIVDPEADQPENRFNDGRCDRRGRFWCGTMNDVRRDPTGALYRLGVDRHATRMQDDIIVPNSICWSPDDTTMYFADTYRNRIVTFPFCAEAGTIGAPTLFVDTSDGLGRPDGSTVDAEGFLWNAKFGGGRVTRYDPKGRVDREIELPVTQPSSCVFGGPGLDILYITTATQRLDADELANQPLAGGLFAIEVGVKGLPEPEYAG